MKLVSFGSSLVLAMLAATGCTPSPEPQSLSPQRSRFVIRPDEAGPYIDRRVRLFRQFSYDRARASGQHFPAYGRWLSEVARAMHVGRLAPSADDPLVVDAQAELEPFQSPLPRTRDLETLAAIREQTRLGSLGRVLTDPFTDQSMETRQAAAARLTEAISLP